MTVYLRLVQFSVCVITQQNCGLFEEWGLRWGRSCLNIQQHVLSHQSCPTLRAPMNCSPPGSSVHEILQAKVLEWAAIFSSRGYSQPRNRTRVSYVSCIAGRSHQGSPHPGAYTEAIKHCILFRKSHHVCCT